jgi:hypothetical protein
MFDFIFIYLFILSLMNKVVALKEIRLQPEEGAPFTAIREGIILSVEQIILTHCLILFFLQYFIYIFYI